MKKRILPLLILIFGIFFYSCQHEVDVFKPYPTPPTQIELGEKIDLQVFGSVIDEDLQPIAGVFLTIGEVTLATNEHGYFDFTKVTTMTKLGQVTIQKEGYFPLTKAISPGISSQYKLDVVLIRKEEIAQFNAGQDASISNDNIVFNIPKNSLVDGSNRPYNGNVKVFMKRLNPEDDHFHRYMPASWIGQDEESEEVVLLTYGMFALELESTAGDKLNLADGSTVKTEISIMPSQLDHAPSEIPIWSANEMDAFWLVKRKAFRSGDKYLTEIPLLSFWNFAQPSNVSQINFQLKDENGKALQNRKLKVESKNRGMSGILTSNSESHVSGRVAADEDLQILLLNSCGDFIKIADIGPFQSKSLNNLGDILVDNELSEFVNVRGLFAQCDGNPIKYGFLSIVGENTTPQYYPLNEHGIFDLQIPMCPNNADINLVGVDVSAGSTTEKIKISPSTKNQDIGLISTCGRMSSYVVVSVEGQTTQLYSGYQLNYDPNNCFWSFSHNNTGVSEYYEFQLDCNGESLIDYDQIPVNTLLGGNIKRKLILPIKGIGFEFNHLTFPINTILTTSLSENEPFFSGHIWGKVKISDGDYHYDFKFKILNN